MRKQSEKLYFKAELLSIEAWHDDLVWSWNNSFSIEKDIYVREDCMTPIKVLRFLRNAGYLSQSSKGKLCVELNWPILEVQNKNTLEPLLALVLDEQSGSLYAEENS